MILKDGDGPSVETGDIVDVFYSGRLMNGFEFDNNLDEDDKPISFEVGNGEVIKAWDEAFVGLHQGTVGRIITPPDYAYGDQDVGDGLIPPNSTLMFDF